MKNALLTVFASLGLIAVLKFAFTPTEANLVPRFEGGEMVGWTYRVDSWWGLKRDNYPAAIENGKPVYFEAKSNSGKGVLPESYDGN